MRDLLDYGTELVKDKDPDTNVNEEITVEKVYDYAMAEASTHRKRPGNTTPGNELEEDEVSDTPKVKDKVDIV